MIELIEKAFALQVKLRTEGFRFAFIGGIAYQAWGEPRVTRDIDATVLTLFEDEPAKVDKLMKIVEPRIQNAKQFALVNRVILAKTVEGVGVDLGMGAFDYEVGAVERAVDFRYDTGMDLRIICAEDLIVQKAFASRDQDWIDIRWVLIRQQGKLDWSIVDDNLPALVELKEEPEILTRLQALRNEFT